MSVKVKVTGISKLLGKLEHYGKTKTEQLRTLSMEKAHDVEQTAKLIVPVDHGRLRSSIRILEPNKIESESGLRTEDVESAVYTNVEYAMRIEFGYNDTDKLGRTYNQPAQPYLYPAWEKHRPDYIKRAIKILRSI